MKNSKILYILIGFVCAVLVVWFGFFRPKENKENSVVNVSSFEDCMKAGYPIMESYPRQCRVLGGETYVEVIPDTTFEPESGIMGTVLLGPTCPVMRDPPDPNCADKPYQTSLALTSDDGSKIIKIFSSDKQGTFKITASPGKYIISSSDKKIMFSRCGSDVIEVKASQYTKADVSCDTGIR